MNFTLTLILTFILVILYRTQAKKEKNKSFESSYGWKPAMQSHALCKGIKISMSHALNVINSLFLASFNRKIT